MQLSFFRRNSHLIAYYFTLALFIGGSFLTESRAWGVNIWGYLDMVVLFVLVGIGLVAPFVLRLFFKKTEMGSAEDSAAGSIGMFLATVGSIGAIFIAAFFYLRGRTHFLGDGYQLLSQLAGDNPIPKARNLGESLLHIWMRSFIGGDPDSAAYFSYAVLSILAGVVVLLGAAWSAKVLYRQNADRILFFLTVITGGYMLLFFGYVENYSIFVASVVLYCLVGLAIINRSVPRWVALPLLVLSVFLHVFGMVLVPSAIYLLSFDTRIGKRLSALSTTWKCMSIGALVLGAGAVFAYLYTTSYFFRFSFVPVLADRFTTEGYTLFSPKHLADLFNFLILLFPGLLLLAVLLIKSAGQRIFKQPRYRYLLVLLISTVAAVSVFDPRLGMPRDWDLLSFAGVPLVLLFGSLGLDPAMKKERFPMVVGLAIVLGAMMLIPRAMVQAVPEKGIRLVEDYTRLDHARNRTTYYLIATYYDKQGDTLGAKQARETWVREFPEATMITKAKKLRYQGKINESVQVLAEVASSNPQYCDAWSNLAEAYIALKMYDSALFFAEVADGLNANSVPIIVNIATAHYYLGHLKKAEALYHRAYALDSTSWQIPFSLGHIYQKWGNRSEYIRFLVAAAACAGADGKVYAELGLLHHSEGRYKKARRALDIALARGFDSATVRQWEVRYPQLRGEGN